jgi:proteic killer suppression protein
MLVNMIRTFNCKETEKIFNRFYSRKFPQEIQRIILRKLRMLNRANFLSDLLVPPGNHLEALKGNRKGQYSIRINDQWRICFVWQDHDAYNVEIIDYH